MTKRTYSRWIASGVLSAALTLSLAAAAKLSKTGTAAVAFHAKTTVGLKVDGTTSDLSVADDGTTVTITVPLGNLKTGVDLRDDHTKNKYLEVASHPKAELKVQRSALKFPADGAESTGDAKGDLTIHGVTKKDVAFHYTAKRSADIYNISGSFDINIKDFNINVPSYLGVTLKPEVNVTANFQAKDN